MPLTYVPRLFQQLENHAIDAIGFMASLPPIVDGDPTLSVQVVAAYPVIYPPPPFVTVQFLPSRHDFDTGENVQDFDSTDNVTMMGIYLPRSTLTFRIFGQSAGECGYIGDCLYSGIVSNYALNPITGEAIEGAVIRRFGETAITILGCDDVRVVESNPADPRPYGQLWQMVFPFRVNVDVLWQGVPYTPGNIDITQQTMDPTDLTVLTTQTYVVPS